MNVEDLWNRYHEPLKEFIASRVRDQSMVDDILQIVFMKIRIHLPGLKDEQSIRGWIYRIAGIASSIFTEQKDQLINFLIILNSAMKPMKKSFTKEAAACIRSSIKKLPEKYRVALELTEIQGLSQKTYAKKWTFHIPGKIKGAAGTGTTKTADDEMLSYRSDRYGNIIDCSNYEGIAGAPLRK
ncbi:hypothetical protein P7F88_10955 [Vibrio hannami]|nr:hypothetical protein [Vibrio hannami]MDG3086602.1 hypothetical protein [Vibrio hannami]